MQQDAKEGRIFSNLVAEFTTDYDPDHPLKIIGGQHRYQAIRKALNNGVNEFHGVKVYCGLDSDQRLDVQLISNTVIAVSADLYDRMQETVRGPELRDLCQKVGLLPVGEDFADKRARGGALTVRNARTFIMNYYAGVDASGEDFAKTDTTPFIAKSGEEDGQWEATRSRKPSIWKDGKLEKAGAEFAALIYDLKSAKSKDPLNAAALAKGRHKTDAENYRGLGYRTDAKERGRLSNCSTNKPRRARASILR